MLNVGRKLDDTIPRREVDARLAQMESDHERWEVRLREIDIQLLQLKGGYAR